MIRTSSTQTVFHELSWTRVPRQVGMQALMMRSEWFAVGRKGAEGPREEHFLWLLGQRRICPVMPLSLVDNFDFPVEGGIRSYFVTSWSVPF